MRPVLSNIFYFILSNIFYFIFSNNKRLYPSHTSLMCGRLLRMTFILLMCGRLLRMTFIYYFIRIYPSHTSLMCGRLLRMTIKSFFSFKVFSHSKAAVSISLTHTPPQDLQQCEKRPTTVSKETYNSVKRDLLQCQTRPTTVSKETYNQSVSISPTHLLKLFFPAGSEHGVGQYLDNDLGATKKKKEKKSVLPI